MRLGAAIVVLSSIMALAPTATASGSELSLTGPAALRTGVTTTLQLGVALTLAGVVCASEADVPVRLALARASGADARLSMSELLFRVPAGASFAGAWSGSGQVGLLVAPSAATGAIEVLASYRLPAQCVASDGVDHGEARHLLAVEHAPPGEAPVVSSTRELPASRPSGLPLPVQLSMAATAFGALVVLAKRVRAAREA